MLKNTNASWYLCLIQLIITILICLLSSQLSFATPNGEGIQVYQKNLHLSEAHKQRLANDITRYHNADNIWDVLREEFSLPHYENHPAVQQKIQWFMNNQDFLLRSAQRAAPYLFFIFQQVKKRHLPAELVLLPIVESGYNPFSLSSMGAAGIWQLMPDTATGLGVKQDWTYDGRRDLIASTHAALNYLAYLQSFFEGRWLLAIAAYNTGEGNVLSAIKHNIRKGYDTDFWSLPLAQQTRGYVPSLLALAIIISHPERYPVYFPPVRNAPYLAQVDIGTKINLKHAATLAGISFKKIQQLNPAFNRISISTKAPFKLVLPIENVEQFSENLAHSSFKRQLDWIHYRVKSRDSLLSLAKKFNTTIVSIKKLNHLSGNNLRPQTILLIPHTEKSERFNDETTNPIIAKAKDKKIKTDRLFITKNNASDNNKQQDDESLSLKYTLQPGDTIYVVRMHDTWDSIARRFHVDSQSIRLANDSIERHPKPGKQLIIPTHSLIQTRSFASKENQFFANDMYTVKRGDTIEKIAYQFNTTPAAIRIANLMDNNSLTEGIKLIVPTHINS